VPHRPTEVEVEIRNRIRLSLAAYEYELGPFKCHGLEMTDGAWDRLALSIRPDMTTGHEVIDKFFKEVFGPDTGCWVRRHPELDKLINLYTRLFGG